MLPCQPLRTQLRSPRKGCRAPGSLARAGRAVAQQAAPLCTNADGRGYTACMTCCRAAAPGAMPHAVDDLRREVLLRPDKAVGARLGHRHQRRWRRACGSLIGRAPHDTVSRAPLTTHHARAAPEGELPPQPHAHEPCGVWDTEACSAMAAQGDRCPPWHAVSMQPGNGCCSGILQAESCRSSRAA